VERINRVQCGVMVWSTSVRGGKRKGSERSCRCVVGGRVVPSREEQREMTKRGGSPKADTIPDKKVQG